jgi:DNA-binding transcriptional MerR regulator
MTEPLLDIGEVADQTGIAPSALRYYERLGLLEPAGRNGLRRTYTPDAIDRVALIVNARANGFTLAEVNDLLRAKPRVVRAQLAEKIEDIDERIAAMEQARAQLGHALTCEHDSILDCPTFRAGLRDQLTQRRAGSLS